MSCGRKIRNTAILELMAFGGNVLLGAGIETSQEECEQILIYLLGCARSEIYLKDFDGEFELLQKKFIDILDKRKNRQPLAYILGETNFWKETLFVDERCLIPRQDTEILVEKILKNLRERQIQEFSFLDIGTGSGAISVAILRECPNAKATLLDISKDALLIARKNIEKYNLKSRAEFVQSNLFESLEEKIFDVILSNPPYLSSEDMKVLQKEVSFEPKLALDGGIDGLDFYRIIIKQAKTFLNSRGLLAFEVGIEQAKTVSNWLESEGYDNIRCFKDHGQIERVVLAQKRD